MNKFDEVYLIKQYIISQALAVANGSKAPMTDLELLQVRLFGAWLIKNYEVTAMEVAKNESKN